MAIYTVIGEKGSRMLTVVESVKDQKPVFHKVLVEPGVCGFVVPDQVFLFRGEHLHMTSKIKESVHPDTGEVIVKRVWSTWDDSPKQWATEYQDCWSI